MSTAYCPVCDNTVATYRTRRVTDLGSQNFTAYRPHTLAGTQQRRRDLASCISSGEVIDTAAVAAALAAKDRKARDARRKAGVKGKGYGQPSATRLARDLDQSDVEADARRMEAQQAEAEHVASRVITSRTEQPSAFGRGVSVMTRITCAICGASGTLGASGPAAALEWVAANDWHGDCRRREADADCTCGGDPLLECALHTDDDATPCPPHAADCQPGRTAGCPAHDWYANLPHNARAAR